MIDLIKNDTGKIIDLIDNNTGNSLTGDVWRLALKIKEKLESQLSQYKMEINRMELELKSISILITKTEKRWENDD